MRSTETEVSEKKAKHQLVTGNLLLAWINQGSVIVSWFTI